MSILKEFERKLESLVEGVFTKSFKSGVQPIELAKKLEKEMNEKKTVSVAKVYAPNHYTFYLSPQDREEFSSFEPQLVLELKEFLKKQLKAKKYALMGEPEIILEERKDLSLGEFILKSKLASPEKQVIQASLTLSFKGEDEEIFFLSKPVTTIGRIESNDIVIPDPSISRHHAQIKLADGKFLLRDLDSTNGTFLDGKRITEVPLRDGAQIATGKIVLKFRRL